MSEFACSGVAAGLIGGAMLLYGAVPATSATLPSPAIAGPGETTTMIEEVQRARASAMCGAATTAVILAAIDGVTMTVTGTGRGTATAGQAFTTTTAATGTPRHGGLVPASASRSLSRT